MTLVRAPQLCFLWQNLAGEIYSEMSSLQPQPGELLQEAFNSYNFDGWHIEKPNRDIRPKGHQKTGAQYSKTFREKRLRDGLCISCDNERHPKSKNFCARHREQDRLKAEAKRRQRAMQAEKQEKREKLTDERSGKIHHFTIKHADKFGTIEEIDGYIRTGCYPDGRLGEVFITIGKPGDAYATLDCWATATSIALQFGAPVNLLFCKFKGTQFVPAGATTNKNIPRCTSILDYVARWILMTYGEPEAVVEQAAPEAS